MDDVEFREVGLEHPAVETLVREHRDDLSQHSPACSVHAFTPAAFDDPRVTLLTAWHGDTLVGCGALKRHGGADDGLGELKTMRTVDAWRGRGIGEAMLLRLIEQARADGLTRLALETGGSAPFAPALALYAKHGFMPCGPFADYVDDPFSVFLSRSLE